MIENKDIEFMKYAITLAAKGIGNVDPNPAVGAVIVQNGMVIGSGFHETFGGLHAERNAIKSLNVPPDNATMYVTLEPCCHYGKTPPCTNAIIENNIKRVVVGTLDPNPIVAGKGIETLRSAGINVEFGVLEDEINFQNRFFFKYITQQQPWVAMKTASTIDGKIATFSGDSFWVSNSKSRELAHELRGMFMSIMVGINTVETDNPMLNCRQKNTTSKVRQPVRIIVDSNARISLQSNIVKTAKMYKTIVAHTKFAKYDKIKTLNLLGVETLQCNHLNKHVCIENLLKQLATMQINSVLLEGGGTLNFSFLSQNFVDEAYIFIAPKFIGGIHAKTILEGAGIEKMKNAIEFKSFEIKKIENDILIHGQIKKSNVYRNY